MLNQERLKRVQNRMKEMHLTQMLVTEPVAVYWLTGKFLEPGERFYGLLIRTGRPAVFYINELFRFPGDIGAEKIYYSDTDDLVPILKKEIDASQKLGVDKTMPSKFLIAMMEGSVAAGYVNGSVSVDDTRAVKDAAEQEKMRISSHINDLAMEQFRGLVRDGITELEVASQMLDIYKSLGAERYSFPPIVAFGDNAADPHHMPDNTVLKEGDTVLFDVGCVYQDYCSDMTRTFYYKKEPDDVTREVYNLVRRANESAEAMLKPGIVISDVDKCARDIITEGGYGPYFTHRLGHFIGLTDHEAGDVSLSNHTLEKAGIIHSVEPGIYNPGTAGVRIEDLVLITPDGHEVLNHYPHDLEVIG